MLDLIDRALAEDLGDGDLTTRAVVPEGTRARARIVQKQPGVPAGMAVTRAVFERVDAGVRWTGLASEGEWREGGPLAQVEGAAASILAASAEGVRAEAGLIRFVARIAPQLSLAHDVGTGGVKAALAEAALWSGVGAEVDVPEGARVLLACRPDRVGGLGAQFEEIGVVGGTALLGKPLDELRDAWEALL